MLAKFQGEKCTAVLLGLSLLFLGVSPRKFDSPLSVVGILVADKAWDVEDILLHSEVCLQQSQSTVCVLRKSIFHLDFLLYPPIILFVSILFYSLLLLQLIVFHKEKEGEVN